MEFVYLNCSISLQILQHKRVCYQYIYFHTLHLIPTVIVKYADASLPSHLVSDPQKALCIQGWTNIILISELQFLRWLVSLNQLCPLSSSVYRSWQAAQVNFGSGGQLRLQCVHSRSHSIFKVEAADWVPRSVSSVTSNVIFSLSGTQNMKHRKTFISYLYLKKKKKKIQSNTPSQVKVQRHKVAIHEVTFGSSKYLNTSYVKR